MMDKFLLVISMILVFYISVNSIQKFSIKFEILDSTINEYKSGYVTDVKVFNSYCDEGYESLVKNFDWPGSHQGCACLNNDGKYEFYKKQFCPSPKCMDIGETKEVNFTKWRGKVICLKRANNTYSDLPIVSYDDYNNLNTCKNDTHKICGSVDEKGNLLCLPAERDCPIIDIAIKKKSSNDINLVKTNADINNSTLAENTNNDNKNILNLTDNSAVNTTNNGSENNNPDNTNNPDTNGADISFRLLEENNTLNLTNGYYVEIQRIPKSTNPTSQKIPVFFRIDTTQPCLDDQRSPSSEYYFPLMKKRLDLMCDKYQNGTEITDNLYKPIDSYPYDEYLKDNNYYSTMHELIDKFKIDISKEEIKIYTKSYPGWSLNCRQEQAQFDNFLTFSLVLNNLTVSIIFHSFISILCLLFIAVLACFMNNYYDMGFKLVNIGFCVFNLIYPIQVISDCNWIINVISDYSGLLCGDTSLNILLEEITNSSLELEYSFILILLLTIVYSLFLVYTLYRWIKPFNREYQERILELK
jgi:hypothetical protein